MPERVTIERLAQWLSAQEDIVLLGHVNPDGDALGSNLAIWHALRRMGKRAVVCLPGGAPDIYGELPGMDGVLDTASVLPFAPKAALSVDVSEPARLGEAGQALFEACPAQGVLDHHPTNTGFGQLWSMDGEAAAVGELALALIEGMGVALTPEIADCLYVAILTDSGQFSFSGTTPATFRAAAKCADAGARVSELARRIYKIHTLAHQKLLGLVLADMGTSEDGRIAWSRMTQAMMEAAGARWEDTDGIVNFLVEIEGVQAAILAEERGEATKLSLRSNVPFNVCRAVALPLGGGGHECAAGATVALGVDEALAKAVALAREAL